jgi:hypothetical protein
LHSTTISTQVFYKELITCERIGPMEYPNGNLPSYLISITIDYSITVASTLRTTSGIVTTYRHWHDAGVQA